MDPRRPAIVVVSEERCDFLLDELGRYARDYELLAAASSAAAERAATDHVAAGGQVALFVSESRLPDASTYEAMHA